MNVQSLLRPPANAEHPSDPIDTRFRAGLIVGLLLAIASLVGEGWFRGNIGINVIVQVVLPLIVCRRYSNDWLDTLTLLTIADIWTNGFSTLMDDMGLPGGRVYLFAATMVLMLIRSLQKKRSIPEGSGLIDGGAKSYSAAWILFYALIVPPFLAAYSIFTRGTAIDKTVWDLHFVAPLLLFFPIRRMLVRNSGFFMGWMIALAIALSFLALTISLTPMDISAQIYGNLDGDMEEFVESTLSAREHVGGGTTQRFGGITLLVTFIGFFFGMLCTADFTRKMRERMLGAALCIVCIIHLCVDWMRGPLLSILGVVLLLLFAATLRHPARRFVPRLLAMLAVVATLGISIMAMLVPAGLARFTENSNSISAYMGDARGEIAPIMLAAFRERPLMGQGVGVPPPGYSQLAGEGTLRFELSYYIVLYRTGLIGMMLVMVPIAFLYRTLFIRTGPLGGSAIFSWEGKFHLSLLLSALTTTISAYVNPYLKTGYLMLIIASYWAYTEHLKENIAWNRSP